MVTQIEDNNIPSALKPADDGATTAASAQVSDDILKVGVEYISGIEDKVAFLPLGPTQDQINNLVSLGKFDKDHIYIGDTACSDAEINENIPQVFGYVIKDDAELERIIMDEGTLEKIRSDVNKGGIYPTIYLMNNLARVEYAQYLGGRIPSLEESKKIWASIPGENNIDKAKSSGIPFTGLYSDNEEKFYHVGISFVMGSTTGIYSNGVKRPNNNYYYGIEHRRDDLYDMRDSDHDGGRSVMDTAGALTFVLFDNQTTTTA